MPNYVVYFIPKGSLHAEELGSGTIFGALCWAIAILGLYDVSKLLQEFRNSPLFAFSSAFPFLSQGNNRLHFYPKPYLPELSTKQVELLASKKQKESPTMPLKQAKLEVIRQAKSVKECHWVSEALFNGIVRGEINQETLCQNLVQRGGLPTDIEKRGSFLITYKERREIKEEREIFSPPPCQTDGVLRNQIDRRLGTTAEGFLFMENELFFAPGAGLWCLVISEGKIMETLLRPAFRYLADTGFGGERSLGKGHFEIIIKPAPPLPKGENGNIFLTLSYYLPQEGEISSDPYMGYRLVNRWAKRESKFPWSFAPTKTPHTRKRLVRLLAPGSLIPVSQQKPIYGRLASVADDGPWIIWHSGLAIGTFVRVEKENEAS